MWWLDIQRQALAGEFISNYILDDLKANFDYSPIPPYLIQSKSFAEANGQPVVTLKNRSDTKDSFHRRMQIVINIRYQFW